MRSVTAAEMKSLDEKAIRDYGIPSLLLMENAGRGIAELIFRQVKGKRVSLFCGKGNNGGDGFVIARHLWNHGFEAVVFLCADPNQLKEDPKINYEILQAMKVPIVLLREDISREAIDHYLECSDVIVDALLGVGLSSDVRIPFSVYIEWINEAHAPVFSVDLPSGLDADTGKILGSCVRASVTATLGLPKKGLMLGEGAKMAGRLCVVDISLPREMLSDFAS